MFPIGTNRHIMFSSLTEDDIKKCLKRHVEEKRPLQITNDFKFYDKIQSHYSKFELGQSPNRNTFRPIVVISWKKNGLLTEINSYIRLDLRITISILIIPLFGIYFSFEQHNIFPFIITLLLTLILIFGLFQILYRFSKKSTLKKLDVILKELNSTK